MKSIFPAYVTLFVSVCLLSVGCSLRLSVRLFNGTDREILVLTDVAGEHIKIAPGANAFLAPWISERHGNRGFIVLDRGEEQFFSLMPSKQTFPAGSRLLPKECAQRRFTGIVYFLEYAADTELFALIPSDSGYPKRVSPQPDAFPAKPNKAPEPTPTSVMPRATSSESERSIQTVTPNPARVMPAVVVAHL